MLQEPNDRLTQAAADMRESQLTNDTAQAEQKILARVPVRRESPRRVFGWAAGLAAAALATTFFLVPSRTAWASDSMKRIAQNGDRANRHMRIFEKKDGQWTLTSEVFAGGNYQRVVNEGGGQYAVEEGRLKNLSPKGYMTVEDMHTEYNLYGLHSAAQILNINAKEGTVSVQQNVAWKSRKVDRYTLNTTVPDAQGRNLRLHMELIADPATERPLEMKTILDGFADKFTTWEYPAPDSLQLRIPVTDKTRVYDIDIQRASIEASLLSHGQKQTVAGQTIELLQLWTDENGNACAIANANYSYPGNYGIDIDNLGISMPPDTTSVRSSNQNPVPYKGRSIQLFFNYAPGNDGIKLRDRVTLTIPVFKGDNFAGEAKFTNVPVNRTANIYSLLRPENLPFWQKSTGVDTPINAVKGA